MNFTKIFGKLLMVVNALTFFTQVMCAKGKGRERVRLRRMDETFFMSPLTQEKYSRYILKAKDRRLDQVTPWSEGRDPSLPLEFPELPKINRACPWEYVTIYNPDRTPSMTLEAVCTSNHCKAFVTLQDVISGGKHNSHSASSYRENSNSVLSPTCEPVKFYRWVKVKKQRRSGKWRHVRRLLPVAVACTCGQPEVKITG